MGSCAISRPCRSLQRLLRNLAAMADLRRDAMYDEQGRRQQYNHMTMSQIIWMGGDDEGGIWQGGEQAAHNLQRLRDHNIGLLINCTTNVKFPRWAGQPGTPVCIREPMYGGPLSGAMRRNEALTVLELLF